MRNYKESDSYASISNRSDDGDKDVYTQYDIEELKGKRLGKTKGDKAPKLARISEIDIDRINLFYYSQIIESNQLHVCVHSPNIGSRYIDIIPVVYTRNTITFRIKKDNPDIEYLYILSMNTTYAEITIEGKEKEFYGVFCADIEEIKRPLETANFTTIEMTLTNDKEL